MNMKQEAINLLELDDLDLMQTGQLDWLTISQADPTFKAGAIPRYTISVDTCLGLPLPPRSFWELYSKSSDMHADFCSAQILNHSRNHPGNEHTHPYSLPLAMLRAWWALQGLIS